MDYYDNVKRAIQFIEKNLKEEICVDDVAREAFCSQFYFTRIFLELTGETPGAYLRKRRLTEAANDIFTGRNIIEVAFDYHFNSQEAFTRSFKEYFSMTPGLYKRNKPSNMGLPKPELKENSIVIKGGKTLMNKEPEIKELQEFKIIGYPYYGIPDRIPEMWQKFEGIYKSIYKKDFYENGKAREKTIAFMFNCSRELNYMISVEADTLDTNIPIEFVGKIIPAATWAFFEVTGEDIDDTMAYAHSEWFPKSGYEYSMCCEMEVRNEGYKGDAKGTFYYCYPIRKRKKSLSAREKNKIKTWVLI